MLETLRSWLNGPRDYFTGVVLFAQLGNDAQLTTLFRKGRNDYRYGRLQAELSAICERMKAQDSGMPHVVIPIARTPVEKLGPTVPNPELYAACKLKADKQYKEAMNNRAILFSMAVPDDFDPPNLLDKIAQRSPLAITVMQQFILASRLYDEADHVRVHGRLPGLENLPEGPDEYSGLPDTLVKATMDNIRKNVNKLKRREQTPERLELIQRHTSNLIKLEKRWALLKP